jgi:hypothetical protein
VVHVSVTQGSILLFSLRIMFIKLLGLPIKERNFGNLPLSYDELWLVGLFIFIIRSTLLKAHEYSDPVLNENSVFLPQNFSCSKLGHLQNADIYNDTKFIPNFTKWGTFETFGSILGIYIYIYIWTEHIHAALTFYSSQNHWISGLSPPPGSLHTQKTQHFGNWTCLRPDVMGEMHLLCWAPYKDLISITGLSSPEDGNRSRFPNVVFTSYIEFRTIDRIQKTSNSECYSLSSEPFRVFLYACICDVVGSNLGRDSGSSERRFFVILLGESSQMSNYYLDQITIAFIKIFAIHHATVDSIHGESG